MLSHESNADQIKAKLILEAANSHLVLLRKQKKILEKKGVTIVPDVVTNWKSIVCSFERIQGLTDDYWDLETGNSPKLKRKLRRLIGKLILLLKKKIFL